MEQPSDLTLNLGYCSTELLSLPPPPSSNSPPFPPTPFAWVRQVNTTQRGLNDHSRSTAQKSENSQVFPRML